MKSVALIILNWNGRDDTLACLHSLSHVDYPDFQVVVVDNHSSDDSVAVIQKEYPHIALIQTDENLGYVGGNNVGLTFARQQGYDYALLLNNDTEVDPQFLQALVAAAEADPAVGIVGPTIYYFDAPHTIWSAGGAINWRQGLTRMIGLNEPDQGQFGQLPRPVEFVTGCALLIKMAVVAQIGVLDDRFFAYYEETEWCVRTARNGYKVMHVPAAKIWHKISIQAREASPTVHYYMTRNRLLFLKATHAGLRPWLHTFLEYGRTLTSWTIKPRWRHKAPQRQAMLQAILDYWRGNFGRVNLRRSGT